MASDLKEIKPRPYTAGLLQFLINIRRSRKYAVYADNTRILSTLDGKRASDVGWLTGLRSVVVPDSPEN